MTPKNAPSKRVFILRYQSCLVVALLWSLIAPNIGLAQTDQSQALSSPDGRIQVLLRMPAPGSTDRPEWSATFGGKRIVSGCRLGLQTKEDGELMAGVRVLRSSHRSQDKRIPVLFGKTDHAQDSFNEIRYRFE